MKDFATLTTRSQDLPHDAHLEHIRIVREWAVLFAGVFGVVIVVSSVLGALLVWGGPLWLVLPFGSAFVCAAIVSMAVIRSLEYSRYCLQTRFDEWQLNQETARKVAELTASQNVNVSVKGRQNVVTVGAGQSVENTRLIPVRGLSGKAVEGVPAEDLAYFCTRAPIIGISKRSWLGQSLPSGRTVNTFEIYDQLIQPMLKAGLIVGRGERSAGRLTTSESSELMSVLGIEPGDVVKDIGPAAGDSA